MLWLSALASAFVDNDPICGDDDPGYPESGAGRRYGSLGSGVGAFDGYGYWRLRNSDRSLGKRSWYLSGSEKRTFYRAGGNIAGMQLRRRCW